MDNAVHTYGNRYSDLDSDEHHDPDFDGYLHLDGYGNCDAHEYRELYGHLDGYGNRKLYTHRNKHWDGCLHGNLYRYADEHEHFN